MADYSTIPNPGVTPNQRLGITAGSVAVGASTAYLIWDWPALFMADLWAPVVYVGMFGIGAFLMARRRRSPFELAIMEFSDLGLKPEIIGSVIVENRSKAYELRHIAGGTRDQEIEKLLRQIANETLDIIHGFRDDPTDVQRSRNVLGRCMDQALKIMQNYQPVENRHVKMGDDWWDIKEKTRQGLQQIADVLAEQHRRNMENNTSALEVDLEVSDQILNTFSN